MKSVLISIQPKWCEPIASGKKTVEVRKTRPKLDAPFKCYIYATKSGDNLYSVNGAVQKPNEIHLDLKQNSVVDELNGKVIGEFVCDEIDEYRYGVYDGEFTYHIPTAEGEKTCVEYPEAEEYGNGKPLYFWHISDLVIYDKPRELREFFKPALPTFLRYEDDAIKRPPQSWCYVDGSDTE